MSACTDLSDRMPDVALGRSRWTADEEHHLATCAECRAEWAIVSTASRLAPRIPIARTPEDIARHVLERIRTERAAARGIRRGWAVAGLAAAAAVGLVVWAQRVDTRPGAPQTGGTTPAPVAAASGETALPAPRVPLGPAATGRLAELAIPELDSLPEEALDSILRVLDDPLARVGAGGDDASVDDEGDSELERALAGLEG
jgi:hypothetical protein